MILFTDRGYNFSILSTLLRKPETVVKNNENSVQEEQQSDDEMEGKLRSAKETGVIKKNTFHDY